MTDKLVTAGIVGGIVLLLAGLFMPAETSFPKYKMVQVEVPTSVGTAVCTFEEFTSGNAIFLGCDIPVGSPGA